ncbi:SOS response-associated peptidase family protein [Methylocystis sp. B8]|uniref:SOS response-associated peptidase family protein n=1 Tax=Methylocystis sp. B8 TaxID=544938 RepID=UPI0010FE404A|nr:SOS response-associated peptidase family protein [Methylocystis sp. B8]TLG77787.1 SOS response-associated peptidase [Methylocystis sp. B8]
MRVIRPLTIRFLRHCGRGATQQNAPASCYAPVSGRFTQHLSWEELHRLAGLIGQPRNLAPRYNIAPTTRIKVIRPAAGGTELVPMRWGLAPLWWKKPLNELPATSPGPVKPSLAAKLNVLLLLSRERRRRRLTTPFRALQVLFLDKF